MNVRFAPDQKQLAQIIRKISSSPRAFPLMEVASLFFSNPEACLVVIETKQDKDAKSLYQCKACRMVCLDRDVVAAHVLKNHFEEYFEKEEIEGEEPVGSFTSVCKCGLSGILLGPVNHHSYAAKVKEVHMAMYASMSVEDFRSRIQTLRDPESIEQWKAECKTKVVYKLKKGAKPDAEPMSMLEAHAVMKDQIADSAVTTTKRATMPAKEARSVEDPSLGQAVKEAWAREMRSPLSLLFALRAAFKHKDLHVFKSGTGRKSEFVTSVKPVPLDAEHAVAAARDIVVYLADHPGCKPRDLVLGVVPDAAADSPELAELKRQVRWLVDKGHVIQYSNGSMSVPNGTKKPKAQ